MHVDILEKKQNSFQSVEQVYGRKPNAREKLKKRGLTNIWGY